MERFIDEMDGLSELVYLADAETYDLLYINKSGRQKFGIGSEEDIRGRKCYEVLQGKDSPCSFCTNHLLKENTYYEWERYNDITKGKYLLKDKLVSYEGRLVRMEIGLDVTAMDEQRRRIESMLANEQIAMECAKVLQTEDHEQDAIRETLAILGVYMKCGRTYIFEIRDEGETDTAIGESDSVNQEQNAAGISQTARNLMRKRMDNTYEWCAPGVTREKDNLQDISVEVIADWMEAFARKEAFIIDNLEWQKHRMNQVGYKTLKGQGIQSLVVVPLFHGEKLMGYLGIDNPPRESMENIVVVLQLLAYFMQAALVRIRVKSSLYRMTFMDSMTGTRNRNSYIEHTQRLNERIRTRGDYAEGCGLGVIFADVNGLKEVNDRLGHGAGDKLLTSISYCLLKVFDCYAVYRIGGDEFVVLCDNIREEVFDKKTAQLKQLLKEKQEENQVSLGLCWSNSVIYIEEIVNEAEADMYERKKLFYYGNGLTAGRPKDENDRHTSLLIRDMDVAEIISELLRLIFEEWDRKKLSLMLDKEFALFDGELQKLFQKEESLDYLEKQMKTHQERKIRDVEFHRKRLVKGLSVCTCCGWLDWKNKEGRNFAYPFAITVILVQKNGRGRCVYMHRCATLKMEAYTKDLAQLRGEVMFGMLRDASKREAAEFGLVQLPENRRAFMRLMMDAFQMFSLEYHSIYYIDIQKDSYLTLKLADRFVDMVGYAGNYTAINQDYADAYLDEVTKVRYLDFTSRRNLLIHMEKQQFIQSMLFTTSQEKTGKPARTVEVRIWLETIDDQPLALLAYHDLKRVPQKSTNEKDGLTGLLSYEKFRKETQKLLERKVSGLVMISMDIQNFKYINEVLGYVEGDRILAAFARELPAMDGTSIFHTRVTADQFLTLVTSQMPNEENKQKVMDTIDSFCSTWKEQNHDIKLVFRVGVYYLEKGCMEIETAIDRANMARRFLGSIRSNDICVYGEEIVRKSNMQNEILSMVEQSMESKDFQIYAQPKFTLRDMALCGAETLVRWMDNGKIRFYPDDFIPVLEKNDFITSLDLYVLEELCQRLKKLSSQEWKRLGRISVNLSAVDVQQGGFADTIVEIVDNYQVPHSGLEFELTETAYFSDSIEAGKVMAQLETAGFTTSVDDFGSGYSVMNMLVNIPASTVKIDKVFMNDSQKSERGRKFLEKMIGIIHELGYRVLCEGIETLEQYEMLLAMGCDEGQGYYFARPMPMEAFIEEYLMSD